MIKYKEKQIVGDYMPMWIAYTTLRVKRKGNSNIETVPIICELSKEMLSQMKENEKENYIHHSLSYQISKIILEQRIPAYFLTHTQSFEIDYIEVDFTKEIED
jgi:hypothetical protein